MSLENFNTPSEDLSVDSAVKKDALEILQENDLGKMLEDVSLFIGFVADLVAERLKFDDEQTVAFKDDHELFPEEIQGRILTAYEKLTPDTVRTFLLVTVIPEFFEEAFHPMRNKEIDPEHRHHLLPLLTTFCETVDEGLDLIEDDTLGSLVLGVLDDMRNRISLGISNLGSVH